MYSSIKRTVAKNSKMSLLNVPYISKKSNKTFLSTVSIKHTVAKKIKMSLSNIGKKGGYFMDFKKHILYLIPCTIIICLRFNFGLNIKNRI